MTKIATIKIELCIDCPYVNRPEDRCEHLDTGWDLDLDIPGIPYWCPLEDSE